MIIPKKIITWAKTHPISQSISLLWLHMTSACSLPGKSKTESDDLYESKCCLRNPPFSFLEDKHTRTTQEERMKRGKSTKHQTHRLTKDLPIKRRVSRSVNTWTWRQKVPDEGFDYSKCNRKKKKAIILHFINHVFMTKHNGAVWSI